MQIYKSVENEEYLRLEEECEASITVRKEGRSANILSIQVPKGDRREGVGEALLKSCCSLLYDDGIRRVEADFLDEISGMTEFFNEMGFETEDGVPVMSVDVSAILSNKKVKKTLQAGFGDASFEPLSELFVVQWDDFVTTLAEQNIKISNSEMARFSQELSGVVYDKENEIKAFIFCTEDGKNVHVDLVASVDANSAVYAMTAFQGMLKVIVESGGASKYKTITYLMVNEKINQIFDVILNGDVKPETVGKTIHAFKKLSDTDQFDEYDIEEDLDEDMEDEWQREIRKIPKQSNVSWKTVWHRNDGRDLGKDISSGMKSSAKNSAYGNEGSSGMNEDVVIDFDKEEDETNGLICKDTVRITADNLGELAGFLSPQAALDMKRPFFRGIVAYVEDTEEIGAVIVYEYKNLDEEADTEAEITWFAVYDEDAGQRLIDEFENEIEEDGTVRTYYEVHDLSEAERKILENVGFDITEKESSEMILTLDDLENVPVLNKKCPDFVKSISKLGDKDFKRGVANCLFHDRKGLLEDIAFLPKNWYDMDLSSYIEEDENITSVFLIHRDVTGCMVTDLLFTSGSDYTVEILGMLRYSLKAALSKYKGNTMVKVKRHNKQVEALMKKLFPDRKGEKVLYIEKGED